MEWGERDSLEDGWRGEKERISEAAAQRTNEWERHS